MKLKLLFACFFGSILIANAQFTVKDDQGNIFNDGDIIEFGSTDYSVAELLFFVTNDHPTDNIYSRVEYVSQTNALDPDFEQLCYGEQCYYGIPLGTTVPPMSENAVEIMPGRTTGMGNHFYSDDAGNGQGNVDFVFSFKQYDGLTSTNEIGTALTFTYRYNPLLNVNEFTTVNLSLHATQVQDKLSLDVNEPVQYAIYNMEGKLVMTNKLAVGYQEIEVSNLNSQLYLIQFKNEAGATKTSKFMIK